MVLVTCKKVSWNLRPLHLVLRIHLTELETGLEHASERPVKLLLRNDSVLNSLYQSRV